MANRFSERAQKVILGAQDFARDSGHDSVVPAHLLFALANLGQGIGWNLLVTLNVSGYLIRKRVEQEMPSASSSGRPGEIPFTADSKRVLEEAVNVATSMECDYVGTEHILLALCRSDNQLAIAILLDAGATEEKVRKAVLEVTGVAAPPNPNMPDAAKRRPPGRLILPMSPCPSILGFVAMCFVNDAGKEVDGVLVLVRSGFDPHVAFLQLLKAIPDLAATPLLFKLPGERPVMRILGGWQVAEGEAETFSY